jgi:cytochrome P450
MDGPITAPVARMATAPGRLPTISHAWRLLRRPLAFLDALRGAGDIVRVRVGPEWAYLVQGPELLRQILVEQPAVFDKGGAFIEAARLVVGNGLGTCPYADHRRQRRLLQPAFNRDRLASYAVLMQREVGALVDSWRAGAVLDVPHETRRFALALLSRALFGVDDAAELVAEVQRSMPVILEGLLRRMFVPFAPLWRLPLPGNRRFDRAAARLRGMVERITVEYRRVGVDHGDLLSTLLAARDEDASGLTDHEVYDQIMTLFLAGIEATSMTLNWALHSLAQYPEVERRLHAEVDEVLAGRIAGLEDVPRLEHTQRVLTETLRLYSPSWLLTRRTTADVELGGHRFARGTTVMFSLYLLHRDPAVFPEPERFDPDRWLPDRARAVPRFAMLPFGAGPRRCIGEAFGMTAETLALATLAGRWRLRPLPGAEPRPVAELTLRPDALRMRLEPRRPGE